jgi:hypothetical protein
MLDMSVDGAFFTKLKKLFIRPVPDFHLFFFSSRLVRSIYP